jgi:hypothetical protein
MWRIPYPEFLRWAAYRRKRGSLNTGMRVETGIGVLASLYANTHSKQRYTRYDFMDHEDGPPVSLEKAKEEWR